MTEQVKIKFYSYASLQNFVAIKEATDYIQLWTSDSRTIECARKRGVRRIIQTDLKYYEITYKCIYSGTKKRRSTGQRSSQRSFRQNCPFVMKVKASLDGNSLVIEELVDEHNHEHTKESYSRLPRKKQLDALIKKIAKNTVKLHSNKSKLHAKQSKPLRGSIDTQKDIVTNFTEEECTVEYALKILSHKKGCIVEIVHNNNILTGIFFQDQGMRHLFSLYPEILFIDMIYKVSNMRIPIYIFAIEDGNGVVEIIAFFLATSEETINLTIMVQLFKKHNPEWEKTKVVMTDKDSQERDAFKTEFPKAVLQISLFHSLRTFKREITTENMGITKEESDFCFVLAKKMAFAKNIHEYNETRCNIYGTKIKPFITYMEKHWYPIRHEWVPAMQNSLKLKTYTNIRLEELNSKLVEVVKKYSNSPNIIKDLDNLLLCLPTGHDRTAGQQSRECNPNHFILPSHVSFEKQHLDLNKINSKRILSEYEKFHLVSSESQKLGLLAFDGPSQLFQQRLKTLETLVGHWEQNVEVVVNTVNVDISDGFIDGINNVFAEEVCVTVVLQPEHLHPGVSLSQEFNSSKTHTVPVHDNEEHLSILSPNILYGFRVPTKVTRRSSDFIYMLHQCPANAACSTDCHVLTNKCMITYLDSAVNTLDVCLYLITIESLAKAIVKAHKRGVRIRVISDEDMSSSSGSQMIFFRKKGLNVRMRKSTFLMHHKFVIVDNSLVMTGSLNWTMQAICGNCDNLIITNQNEIVEQFCEGFNEMWENL